MGYANQGQGILLVGKFLVVAAQSIYYWELLTTIHLEYRRIWKARWSAVKVLFLLNRWLAACLVTAVSISFFVIWPPALCEQVSIFEPLITWPIMICGQGILIIRNYAIYNCSKKLLAFLLFLVVGESCFMIPSALKFKAVELPPGVAGCLAGSRGLFTAFFWITPAIVDFILLALQIAKIYWYYRRGTTTPILKLILRDGVVYFVVVFALNMVTTVFFLQSNQNIQSITAPLTMVMVAICCGRLVLNLKAEDTASAPFSFMGTHHFGRHGPSGSRSLPSHAASDTLAPPTSPRYPPPSFSRAAGAENQSRGLFGTFGLGDSVAQTKELSRRKSQRRGAASSGRMSFSADVQHGGGAYGLQHIPSRANSLSDSSGRKYHRAEDVRDGGYGDGDGDGYGVGVGDGEDEDEDVSRRSHPDDNNLFSGVLIHKQTVVTKE